MLQQIRDHLTGWVAILIFAPLILAFALWGVQNYQMGGRNFAAKVNGEEIPLADVQEAQRNRLAMFQQFAPDGLTPEMEAQIRREVLSSFVRRTVLAQRAEDLGFRVSNSAVGKAIRQIPQFQGEGGFDRATYERMLALQGYTPPAFEAAMRKDMMVQQLQEALTRSSFATPAEVKRRVELEGEQREVGWLTIPAAPYEAEVTVDEAQIAARYEERRDDFVTPETVAIEYVELRAEDLAAGIEVEEADARAQYEQDVASGRFQRPEERKARHILIKVEGDEAAARAELEALRGRVLAGEDFATLAREHSDDEVTAKEGGDLGWVTQDMMVPQFSEALFALEPGQVSEPVRTEFGLHLIQLEDKRGGEVQPFEEVRDELMQELKQRRADALYYERAEQLGQRAFESRDSLAPVAEELGLTVQRVEGVTRRQGQGIAAEARVRDAAFSPEVIEDGANSDVIEIGTGRAVVLRVVDRKPETLRPLEEVRGEIEAALRAEGARARAAEVATNALERLKGGASLEALAQELGVEYHAPEFLPRQGNPIEVARAVFAAPKPVAGSPQHGSTALGNGDQVVYAITDVRPGRMLAQDDEERERRARELGAARGNAELAAYITALESEASVVVPPSPDELAPVGM